MRPLSPWLMLNFLLCSVGDLNPILGFHFPLFSTHCPGKLPLGWKTVESSGSKSVANCGGSTYILFLRYDIRLRQSTLRGSFPLPSRQWKPHDQDGQDDQCSPKVEYAHSQLIRYNCIRSPPRSEIRLTEPANPLALTSHFCWAGRQMQYAFFLLSKRIYHHHKKC